MILDAFSASIEGEGEAVFVKTSPTHKINFESDDDVDEHINKKKRQRSNSNESQPPPPSINKPLPPPPPQKGKQLNIKTKPPPPSKPKQGQPPPPPPPSKTNQGHRHQNPSQIQKSAPSMEILSQQGNTTTKEQSSPIVKQSKKPAAPMETQSPNEKPNISLPQGWISVWSKSQRRWYYFDQRTNKSVWEWPPPGKT